jgi:hypothetical protein
MKTNKTLLLLLLLILSTKLFAQSGDICEKAIVMPAGNPSCITKITSYGNELWFEFVATSTRMLVTVNNPTDTTLGHIHEVRVIDDCTSGALVGIDSVRVSTGSFADSLLFIDTTGYIIGNTYYIRTFYDPSPPVCQICKIDSVRFDICVQALQSCPFTQDPCNFVFNGGFEAGPISGNCGQIYSAAWWYNDMSGTPCNGYTGNTPDVMDINSTGTCNLIPTTLYGSQTERSGLCRYGNIGGPESCLGTINGTLSDNFNYTFSFYVSAQDQFNNPMYTLTNIWEIRLMKNGSCTTPTPDLIYTTPAITPTNYPTIFTSWIPLSHNFTLTAAQAANNYDRIEFRPSFSGPTTYNGIFFDDVSIFASSVNTQTISSICPGGSDTIGVSNDPNNTYSWSPGGQTTSQIVVSPAVTTSYVLSITTPSGCVAYTTTITVVVNRPDATISGSQTKDCDSIVTYNAPCVPGVQYTWNVVGGTGFPLTGCSCDVNWLPGGGTITLIAVDTLAGCTNSDTLVVLPGLVLDSLLGSTFKCDTMGQYFLYTNVVDSNAVINWYTSTGDAIIGNGNDTISINWNTTLGTNSWLYVFVTDTSSGCTYSDSIYVRACCVSDTGLVIYNDTASVLFGSGNAFMFFRHWNVNGTFVVDINLDLLISNINMAPGSKIIVTGGHKLFLDKDTVRAGCCEMYDAIEAESISDTIEISSCYMGDAIRGIVSNNGATFTAYGTNIFNRNRVSITVNPYAGNHSGTVSEATFTSLSYPYCPTTSGTLLPPYAMQWPQYGVFVTGVDSITIGNPLVSTATNNYSNLKYGIRTKFTNAGIYNNNFVNVDRDGSLSKGIWCGGHYPTISPFDLTQYIVRVGGDDPTQYQKNTFADCPFGVFTDTAMTTIVHNNTFVQTYPSNQITLQGTAVRVDNCYGYDRNIDVQNDSIINHLYGYYGNQNNGTITQNVSNNIITRLQPGNTASTGVYIICNGSNSGTTTVLKNNIFADAVGIRLNSVLTAIVDSNNVNVRPTLSNTIPVLGIWAVNSVGVKIRFNYVALENPASPPITNQWVRGIYVGTSATSDVLCNTIDSLGVGIYFEGSCLNSSVFNNQMVSTFTGIGLNNGAIISPQGSTATAQDNTWSGAVTRRLFTTGPVGNPTLGNLSTFYYRAGAIYLPAPTTTTGLPNIAIPIILCTGTPDEFICPYVQPQLRMGDQNEEVANGEIIFPGNEDAGTWISREGLYRTMLEDSTFAIGDSLLANFKDSSDQANVGKFTSAMEVHSQGSLNSQSEIVAAYDMTTTLVANGNVEQNYQALESIMLGHLQNGGGLTAQEIIILQGIAQLCPFTDGNAVYLARGLLAPIDTIEYISSCEGETEENSERIAAPYVQESNSASFKLYPNPTNGSVTLDYQLNETETGKLDVYTITGNLVISIDLDNAQKSKTVTLPQIDSGVYLYKVTVNGELKKVERLVIIK